VLAGNVPLMMDSIITGLPHVRSGALRGLAVSTANRSPLAPDIPPVAESGVAGVSASLWYGIVAPPKTPPAIVQKLAREIDAVTHLADVRQRLLDFGAQPVDSGPAAFGEFLDAEAGRWGDVVRATGERVN